MADLLNDQGRCETPDSNVWSTDQRPAWFITGGSSGFGAATVRAAIARGYQVAATARDARALRECERPGNASLLALDLDLRDKASIATAVERAHEAFGRIDVLFNNAGTATLGAIEELTDDLLRDQLEVNLVGPLAVVRAVLPHMRQRQRGRILQMSSMGGRCAFPGLGGVPREQVRAGGRLDRAGPGGRSARRSGHADRARRLPYPGALAGAADLQYADAGVRGDRRPGPRRYRRPRRYPAGRSRSPRRGRDRGRRVGRPSASARART